MSTPQSEFFVIGITHVDLAWKRGRAEMSEMLELVVIRLLDALEHNPEFKYLIEQAAHFRELQKRRPDLVERLRPFLASGRLEFVGGMASTLECNLPDGECFVRNQHMGLEWVRETWGVAVETGWLVDTFGIHAQMPQLMRGFGLAQAMANRFGGSHTRDLFLARGLDGSEITVAGWGTYAAYIHPENLSWRFCKNWDDIESCFDKADYLTGPGPYMVLPYTENEMPVSLRPQQIVEQRRRERPEQIWRTATPREFFDALTKTGRNLPVVDSDLNPEFTGCFSLRHTLRLRNRRVETRLLEAEKWAALANWNGGAETLEEAWWQLAYVQFHDVFTGSHPTAVYEDALRVLDEIESAANSILNESFTRIAPVPSVSEPSPDDNTVSVLVFNGLPWDRQDVAAIPLPPGWIGISSATDTNGTPCAFEVQDGVCRALVNVPATAHNMLRLEAGELSVPVCHAAETGALEIPHPNPSPGRSFVAKRGAFHALSATEFMEVVLENEWIRVEFDTVWGIGKLVWKPTNMVLLENAGSWLVAQRDDGNFQIENPAGPEVAAASGTLRLQSQESLMGQTARLSGEFPPLAWAGSENALKWEAAFFLPAHRPELRLALTLDWKGEATRLRLTLPTCLDTSTGIYEIPFGVARRKPYSPRTNAKGEWPARRFVALESDGHGIALVNTGVGGVEVSGGTLYTTLLRAPRGEYSGMVADATSSQHGRHQYEFALLPYAGSWADAKVVCYPQECNNPLLADVRVGPDLRTSATSFLRLTPDNVVLAGIKAADGRSDRIIRVYETAGRETECQMQFAGEWLVHVCDLRENTHSPGTPANGELRFQLRPFEIQTFRLSSPERANG